MSDNQQIESRLSDVVKTKINFAEFLEKEIGCSIKWYEENVSGGIKCPLPGHKDTKPSFRIKFVSDGNFWIFNCLGCGVHGTIINFCEEYYGLSSYDEAVSWLCKKFNIQNDNGAATSSLKYINKKIDFKKRLEYAHIVTSNQCRVLLRKNYDKHRKWVGEAYRKMNEALSKEDISVIESVGMAASKKMGE